MVIMMLQTPILASLLVILSLLSLVSGQGCTNRCPPVNFGVVVPALCEGDLIDDTTSDSNGVAADINRVYDVCYPTATKDGDSLSFTFDDLRGPSNTVTVIANYYTGCNAGRRESGVFAHVAQKYYDLYGPDKVHFIQSVKGGGTCDQWSMIYQQDALQLFPNSETMVKEMPWSVDDNSYKIRDEFFTSPFGHPAYVIMDGNLQIKHKFIGPCCGYESYYGCTPDIARTLDTTLSGFVDTILLSDADDIDVDSDSDSDEDEDVVTVDCTWLEWSPCSIRCGPTPGRQIRFRDPRCSTTQQGFNFPIFESRECAAPNSSNCNVEDGGSICIPELGEDYIIREVHGDFHSPRDVKFHPTPGYHLGNETDGRTFAVPPEGDEAWIVNGNNHSVSILNAVGDVDYQSSINRQDRGYYHYLINGTAISFNSVRESGRTIDRDTFQYWSICNDNNNNYLSTKESNYFMGPTLYDSSPLNKNLVNKLGEECNPLRGEECFFLHSDMLHESPSCRGIVHDPELETSYGTVYWVFDSTGNRNVGQLVRYDFQQPHGPGSMDHSIASVRRFIEVELETSEEALEQAGVHAGMVVHPTTRDLYIAVPGKNHILKVDADSGQFARTAREEYPIYSNRLPSFEYSIWECVEQSIFASQINQPSGLVFSLDYERLFVAERGTGSILVYEVETQEWLATIRTKFRTIGGLAISPNGGELYFVDADTNTLQSISIIRECDQVYASRTNPEYKRELERAKEVLGVSDPFTLLPTTDTPKCTVDPIVPNIAFFDQVHDDTGYADDNPDVQSINAGMNAAAALLANRTDCEVDSDLNFDALLLGGYYCHTCLPDQHLLCGGGTTVDGDTTTPGSCTNVQWEGYICDNEFQIVDITNTGLPGTYYQIQTMNGTNVDSNTLVLKRSVTYTFQMDVDDEVCLTTTTRSAVSGSSIDNNREDVKLRQSGLDEQRDSVRGSSRDPSSLSEGNNKSENDLMIEESVTLGCATRFGGPLIFNVGSREMTALQITAKPSASPSESPSVSVLPSAKPSASPSESPSATPSASPNESPSTKPSASPSESPSAKPSASPSTAPSAEPNAMPSTAPSAAPSASPSATPSAAPSAAPSATPSVAPSATPSAAPSTTPSAAPSAAPSTSPSVEGQCEDNSNVQFKVPKNNGKKKKTKCKKIKKKDCDTEFKFKMMVDGVSKGKPQDFCQETCNPILCCKDGTDKDYKIKTKNGEKVKGKFSCQNIKEEDYCKDKLRTGEKLKDVCKRSCGQCE